MRLLFLALLINMVISEGVYAAQDIGNSEIKNVPKDSAGMLVGTVMKGPLRPIEMPGQPSEAPVAGVKILIKSSDGREVKSTVTDEHGRYSLSLPPGTYRIEMPSLPKAQFTKDLPANVTIKEGEEIRINITIDTGIR